MIKMFSLQYAVCTCFLLSLMVCQSPSLNFSARIEPSTAVSKPQENVSVVANASRVVTKDEKIVSEGGTSTVESHRGRENVIEPPTVKAVGKAIGNDNQTATFSDPVKPVHDQFLDDTAAVDVPQEDHQKLSVPKKGVDFPPSDIPPSDANKTNNVSFITNTNNNVLNKTTDNSLPINKNASEVVKKPVVTEHDDDYVEASDSKKDDVLSLNHFDSTLDKKNNRSDYIVPIVAVILSVPLVAILISVVYKRGADWWQHRNYKRMDFLIEGMYHN